MKTTTKVLVLLLALVMLIGVIPFNAFAATTYTVTLKCGPEGAGTATKTLTKTAGQNLSLQYTNSGIQSAYGMYPSTGGSGFGAQRVFIEWNTKVDSNGKGVGTAYRSVYNVDANVTLYAVWGFEIQYNADGGVFPSTGNSIFLKYVADCDDNNYQNPKTLYGNFDFPEGSNAPTKAGCRRVAMSSGADFFGLLYPDMSFFTTETSAQNLTIPPTGGKMPWSSFHCATTAHGNPAPEFYAIWEPSVTYDPNGGTGSAYSEYLDWDWGPVHYYNSYYVDSNTFSKSGTSFVGWNTKPDGSGTSYSAGQNIGGQRSDSDPIVLYAQWADGSTGEAAKYTMTFDVNGGYMMAGTTYQVEYGQNFGEAMGIAAPTPYRNGYNFLGWYCAEYDYWLNTADNMSVNEDITFVAQWESAVPTYSLVLNVNGGKLPIGYYTSYTFKDGESFNDIIGGFPVPTYEGYLFDGWMLSTDNSVIWTDSFGDQTFTYGQSVTLIAQWTEDPNYVPPPQPHNVTFDANGGVMPSGYNTTYVVYDDASIADSIGGFPVPTKTGYLFDGWMLSTDNSVIWTDSFGTQTYTFGADITLIAQWSEDPNYVPPSVPYTVSFSANGGSIAGTSSFSVYTGQVYSEVITKTPYVVRDRYAFSGWYCSAYDYTLNLSDVFSMTQNVTFVALWTPIDPNGTYTMTLDPNGGTMPAGYSTTYYFKADEKFVDVIGGYPVPTRAGATFNGWMRVDWPFDHHWTGGWGSQPYTFGHDVTLQAQWIENCSHSYVQTASVAATCIANGSVTYTCSNCGNVMKTTIVSTGHSYAKSSEVAATCTEEGYASYTCQNCGDVQTNVIAALGHSYGEWEVYKEATTEPGEERSYCVNGCGAYESREIPAVLVPVDAPTVTVNGKIVSISGADNIEELAYAIGLYTTYDEIENASGCTFVGSGYIANNCTNGIFNLSLDEVGTYTLYVLMSDTREYFLTVTTEEEVVEPEPEPEEPEVKTSVTVDAVTLTVSGLTTDVKDFFIAKGVYSTYREVNTNKLVRVTAAKIGDATGYSYTVTGSGNYTVCVRYNDNTLEFHYVTVEVVEPTYTANGLQLTVNNLEGIKVVRTALGEYSSGAQIKRAEGARAFTAKYIPDKSSYMIQYRATGTYTVAVCYENGYTVIWHIAIEQKVPTFEQNGNTVIFGELDGLKVARYAMGEYTTSSQIKAAAGSVALTASKVIDGKLTVTLENAGTYTFCVQYDDESYNYYVITVE